MLLVVDPAASRILNSASVALKSSEAPVLMRGMRWPAAKGQLTLESTHARRMLRSALAALAGCDFLLE